jgi:hypothetical protein
MRKDAKAQLLNSRALALLQSERAKANLGQPKRPHRSGSLASSASRYTVGYSANGSDGQRLGQGLSAPHRHRKRGMVKKIVGNVSFDTSQIRDHVAEAGEKISAATAKAIYSQVTPNCQKASFKGPFVRKEK